MRKIEPPCPPIPCWRGPPAGSFPAGQKFSELEPGLRGFPNIVFRGRGARCLTPCKPNFCGGRQHLVQSCSLNIVLLPTALSRRCARRRRRRIRSETNKLQDEKPQDEKLSRRRRHFFRKKLCVETDQAPGGPRSDLAEFFLPEAERTERLTWFEAKPPAGGVISQPPLRRALFFRWTQALGGAGNP